MFVTGGVFSWHAIEDESKALCKGWRDERNARNKTLDKYSSWKL